MPQCLRCCQADAPAFAPSPQEPLRLAASGLVSFRQPRPQRHSGSSLEPSVCVCISLDANNSMCRALTSVSCGARAGDAGGDAADRAPRAAGWPYGPRQTSRYPCVLTHADVCVRAHALERASVSASFVSNAGPVGASHMSKRRGGMRMCIAMMTQRGGVQCWRRG